MSDRDLSVGVRILTSEIRQARTVAGLTQSELSVKMNYARSMVGMWETGQRTPDIDHCRKLDEALSTDGRFARMRREIGAEDARERVAALAKVESKAASIEAYSPLLVPGLMQTRAYMRRQFSAAKFSGASEADIDQLVETRLARQGALAPAAGPMVVLTLKDGTQVAHLDGPVSGTTTNEPGTVDACNAWLNLLRSQAASVPDSIAMIEQRLKELHRE